MSVATELEQVAMNLNSALTEINDKLTAKGGTASETVYGVASAVENLPSGGNTVVYERNYSRSIMSNGNGDRYILSNNLYAPMTMLNADGTEYYPFNKDNITEYRYVIKFMHAGTKGNVAGLFGSTKNDSYFKPLSISSAGKIGYNWNYFSYEVPKNTWLYAVYYYNDSQGVLSVYGENGAALYSVGYTAAPNKVSKAVGYGTADGWVNDGFYGKIDFDESFIEINNVVEWGKITAKTRNMGIPTQGDDI